MVAGNPFEEADTDSDSSEDTSPDESTDEVQLTSGFEDQLRNAVDGGHLDKLTLVTIRNGLSKVDDEDLLKEAYEVDERDEAREMYETRLNEMDSTRPMDEGEQSELDEVSEESEEEETEDDVEFETAAEAETEEADISPETIEGDGGAEAAELEQSTAAEDEDDSSPTRTASVGGELRETESDGRQKDSSMASEIDISEVAPDALTPEEAAEQEHRWSVLIWGPPGVGKTHFSYTMPEPVMIIDTEGKGSDIAHKFEGQRDFLYWDPDNYDQAKEALHQALDSLDEWHEATGDRGTIVVDSMSVMWGWAQQKYVDKYYNNKSVDDVNFTSGFGGGESDWKKIKDLHNAQFRELMVNSPYHICWTAMREKDYRAALQSEQDRDKPVGEKENVYKVDTIIHLEEDNDGVPRGDLEKSGLIKNRFSGLEYPTFDSVKRSIEAIDEAESDSEKDYTPSEIREMAGEEFSIVKGNPRFVSEE